MEKDNNIEETINDNEEKDYSEYIDQPENLFPLAQEQFNYSLFFKRQKFKDLLILIIRKDNNKDFVEGINILDKSINYAIEKYGGEEKIEMAQFYNKYANGLIQKLMNSDKELPNTEKNTKIEEKESEDGVFSKNGKISENKEEGYKENEESEENTDEVEKEVAFENLQAANRILTKYLKKYNGKEVNALTNKVIEYYLELSETYYQLASLEKMNLNFQQSDKFYTLSSEILKKYGNKFSLELAGLYFELAKILDLPEKLD